MRLTLKSALKKYDDSLIDCRMGEKERNIKLDYNRLVMFSLMMLLGISMIATMWSMLVERELMTKLVTLFIFLVCGLFLLSLIKEKSNLDLISKSFEDLSYPAREEIIKSIIENNNNSSSQLVGLLEKILDKISSK